MEITISKEDVIQLLTNYYKKTEGFTETIQIITEKDFDGYGYYGSKKEIAKTKIERKEEMNLYGITVPVVSALTKTEVLGVFQNILSEKGYSVNSIGFDQGITTEYHYNDDYKVAYCNGLKLDVEKQVKEYRR